MIEVPVIATIIAAMVSAKFITSNLHNVLCQVYFKKMAFLKKKKTSLYLEAAWYNEKSFNWVTPWLPR